MVVSEGAILPLLPTMVPVSTRSFMASFAQEAMPSVSLKLESVLPELPCGSLPIAFSALFLKAPADPDWKTTAPQRLSFFENCCVIILFNDGLFYAII